MSLKSIFGKLGAIGLGAAAPFTGGASLAGLPAILGAGGAALGAFSGGQAQNRDAQYSGQMDLAQLLNQREMQRQQLEANSQNDAFSQNLQRSQEGRASGQDAWRKLLSAQHTMTPGAQPQLAGKYNVAPRQATGAETQGADAMTQEVMARLQGGNPIAPVTQRPVNLQYDPMSTVDPKLMKSGLLEKIIGIGGAGLSAYGALTRPQVAKGA